MAGKYELVAKERHKGLRIEGRERRFDPDAVYMQIDGRHMIVPESRVVETIEIYAELDANTKIDLMCTVRDMRSLCSETQIPLLQVDLDHGIQYGTSEISMETLN